MITRTTLFPLIPLLFACGSGGGMEVNVSGAPSNTRVLRVEARNTNASVAVECLGTGACQVPLDLSGALQIRVFAKDDQFILAEGHFEGTRAEGEGPVQVTLTALTERRAPLYMIKKGEGQVLSLPSGVECGAQCRSGFAHYELNTPIKLTATPAAGYEFTGWTGACGGTGCCNVTANKQLTVTANFQPIDVGSGTKTTALSGNCPPSGLNAFPGIKTGVALAELRNWSVCHLDTYNGEAVDLKTLKERCTGRNILLGCRRAGTDQLLVAANAPREDVFMDTGTTGTHEANGAAWYFNEGSSWGFAPLGENVQRALCDVTASSSRFPGHKAQERLCWHTSAGKLEAGWRCGEYYGLSESVLFERVVMQLD